MCYNNYYISIITLKNNLIIDLSLRQIKLRPRTNANNATNFTHTYPFVSIHLKAMILDNMAAIANMHMPLEKSEYIYTAYLVQGAVDIQCWSL